MIGESVLLHVAARCCWLKSVDASWSNVSDNGVQALVDNVKRYRLVGHSWFFLLTGLIQRNILDEVLVQFCLHLFIQRFLKFTVSSKKFCMFQIGCK